MLPALLATPGAGSAISSVAGAMSGGPATSGSNQDVSSNFGTGNKTVNFGPPPAKPGALQNPYVMGGIVLAVAVVAVAWMKRK